jgi:hypothetical protein
MQLLERMRMNKPQDTSNLYLIAIGIVSVVLIWTLPVFNMYEKHHRKDKTGPKIVTSSISDAERREGKELDLKKTEAPTIVSEATPSKQEATKTNPAPTPDKTTENKQDATKDDDITGEKLRSLVEGNGLITTLEGTDTFNICMINAVSFQFPFIVSTTFQNRRESSCDLESFNNMNTASVRAQLNAILNPFQAGKAGPYRSTATKNLGGSSYPYTYLGNQRFAISFKVKLGLFDIIKHPEFALGGSIFSDATYYPLKAQQNLNLFWTVGDPAYCLITNDGRVYLMTDYSAALFPNLTRYKLEALNRLLVLPTGWKFVKVTVKKPIWITDNTENGFVVEKLFDNLGNFYVKVNLPDSLDYANEVGKR